jgi:nitrogen fixation NifU-like protein
MELKQLYREIVNEHNLHPVHKKTIDNPDLVMRGVNPSCGDDINLQFRIEDDIIKDAMFEGSGCAISQASVDMMIDDIIGKSREEALDLAGKFMGMIKGTGSEEDLEALDEAAALQDVAHMPARVKCAVLGWHTMEEALSGI